MKPNKNQIPGIGKTIKAHIEKDDNGKGLWLMIDRPDMEGIAIGAITEDELIPIMEAIKEYIGMDINRFVLPIKPVSKKTYQTGENKI